MTRLTKTFATGSVSLKTGAEGPRHDPYGYEEWTWTRNGETVILHEGLGSWLQTNNNRYDLHARGDENAARLEFEKLTGVSMKTLERVIHRPKRCCDRQEIVEVAGFPGETLYRCESCGKIVGGNFDESAVI